MYRRTKKNTHYPRACRRWFYLNTGIDAITCFVDAVSVGVQAMVGER